MEKSHTLYEWVLVTWPLWGILPICALAIWDIRKLERKHKEWLREVDRRRP